MQIEITNADACFIARLLTKEKLHLENRLSYLEPLSQELGEGSLFQDARKNEIADDKRVLEQINRLDGVITKGLVEENQA